jgi:hypothetical protein
LNAKQGWEVYIADLTVGRKGPYSNPSLIYVTSPFNLRRLTYVMKVLVIRDSKVCEKCSSSVLQYLSKSVMIMDSFRLKQPITVELIIIGAGLSDAEHDRMMASSGSGDGRDVGRIGDAVTAFQSRLAWSVTLVTIFVLIQLHGHGLIQLTEIGCILQLLPFMATKRSLV